MSWYNGAMLGFKLNLVLKRVKVRTWVALVVLTVLLPAAIFSLYKPREGEAAWFDDAWAYRKPVTIPSHTTEENNVYVTVPEFNATDTSRFQADCGDLRFTKQNGELLPYFVVDCDATATVHVLFDVLPAGASTYYMYYGNPGAPDGFVANDFSTAASGLGEQTLGSEAKSNGPVAYWSFDQGVDNTCTGGVNDVCDSFTNMLDAANNGAAWRTEEYCVSGKCMDFDKAGSDYVLPPSTTLNNQITTQITVSAWVKWRGNSDQSEVQQYVLSAAGTNGFRFGTRTATTTGIFAVYCGRCTTPTYYEGKALPVNRWTFLSVTMDGSNVALYQDGVQTGQGSYAGSITEAGNAWMIGAYVANTYNFNGMIDELKVYPYARSAAQVKADFIARGGSEGAAAVMGASNQKFLSDGLVGYWKMDEASWNGTASEVVDSSGNGNHGVRAGDATTAAGKFGNGGTFDGTGDSVLIGDPSSGALDFGTGDFTLSSWFYVSSLPSAYKSIINKGAVGAVGYGLTISDDNKLSGSIQATGGTNQHAKSVTAITAGSWQHATVVFKRNDKIYIYINGNLNNSVSYGAGNTGSVDNSVDFRLGSYSNGTEFPFNGLIDEARIYNRALSPNEVKQLYNWAPGPVAHWKMDEGSGATAFDQSGNGLDGSITGAIYKNGKLGKALSFDNNADYVSVAYNSLFNFDINDSYTISSWIKLPSSASGDYNELIHAPNGSSRYPYRIFLSSSAQLITTIYNGTTANAISTNFSAYYNQWVHVSFTKTPSQMCLYLNGKLVASCTAFTLTGTTAATSGSLRIGRHPSDVNDFWGEIDDVKIYNYARTAQQVVEDMNGGSPVSGSTLPTPVSHWKFDEGQGQITNNSGLAGSSSVGTLGGATTSGEDDDPTWKIKADCKINGCLSFDGGDYIDLTGDTSYMVYSKTITFWAKPNGAVGATTPVLSSGGANWYAGFGVSNQMMLSRSVTAGTQLISYSPVNTVIPNEWHHYGYTVTVSGSNVNVSFFRDAKLISTSSYTTGSSSFYAGTWIIGAFSPASNYYNGLLDELKFYNSPLTEEQIKQDMNAGGAINFGATANSEASLLTDGEGAPPVAYWSMDEKQDNTCAGGVNDVCDKSGNTSDLALTSTTWTRGKYGSGLDFTSSSVASVSDNANISLTTAGTVEAWVNSNSLYPSSDGTTRYRNIVNKWTGGTCSGADEGFLFDWYGTSSAGTLRGMTCNGTNSESITHLTTLTPNTWYHLAYSFDGTNHRLYINGSLVKTQSQTIQSQDDTSTLWIGCGFGCGSADYRWNGKIDEIKIYNYARTQAQVAYDYNRGEPIAHWKFDECEGATAHDSSGNGNHGTINPGDSSGDNDTVGTCASGNTQEMWGEGASGKYSGSLGFDGTNDTVSVTNSIGQSDFSLSAWIKTIMSSSGGILAYNGSSRFRFAKASTQGLRYGIYGDSSWAEVTDTGYSLNDGNWHHVAVTFDRDGVASSYVDGVLKNSTLDISGKSTVNITGVTTTIGFDNFIAGSYFNGQIDDVRIYNYALSAAQVKKLMNEGGAVRFGPSTGGQ